ncbi:MAG: hypothetical protein IID18_01060 [Nitrospinae bacterium]|nr:hypothetical protein [Nitrospinota bacterium]
MMRAPGALNDAEKAIPRRQDQSRIRQRLNILTYRRLTEKDKGLLSELSPKGQ